MPSCLKGEFIRYNWTLSSDKLPQDPDIATEYRDIYRNLDQITDYDEVMQTVHFRAERQTFKAFPHLNRYLFVIHTYLYPSG